MASHPDYCYFPSFKNPVEFSLSRRLDEQTDRRMHAEHARDSARAALAEVRQGNDDLRKALAATVERAEKAEASRLNACHALRESVAALGRSNIERTAERDAARAENRELRSKLSEQWKQIQALDRLHSEAVHQRNANARTVCLQASEIARLTEERDAAQNIVAIKIDEAEGEFGSVRVDRDRLKKLTVRLARELGGALEHWAGNATVTRYNPAINYDASSAYGTCQRIIAEALSDGGPSTQAPASDVADAARSTPNARR